MITKTRKILIIDDDEILVDEMAEILRTVGFYVDTLNSGTRAVERACKVKPDLILLDMKLDGKSGFQIADDLKNLPETAHIPILAMTGSFTEKQHASFMLRMGIDALFLKPFAIQDILSKIELLTNDNQKS
jgi:chemosensory pili system protein ChpA (sensor histidine kinase/response regulator)